MDDPSLVAIDYSRQGEMDQTIYDYGRSFAGVAVIGCGGIGFWAATMIALMGQTQRMLLIDDQLVDASNLNRLPVSPTWVGLSKVHALARTIRTLRPELKTVALKIKVENEHEVMLTELMRTLAAEGRTLIIDTTDDGRIQKRMYEWIKKWNSVRYTYIKLGYEGFQVGAYRNMDIWLPDDYRPGYRTANANALSSAIAAGMGLLKAALGNSEDMNLDLRKLVGMEEPEVVDSDEPERDEEEEDEDER